MKKKVIYDGYLVLFKIGVVDTKGILYFDEQKRAFKEHTKAVVVLTDADYEPLVGENHLPCTIKMSLNDLDIKGMIT